MVVDWQITQLTATLEAEREERRSDMQELKQMIAAVSAEVKTIDTKINQYVLESAITKERMATKKEVEEAKKEIRKIKFVVAIVGTAVVAALAGPAKLVEIAKLIFA